MNKINIDGLKDLIRLLNDFKNVSLLVQTGTRPSLHMAYVGIHKLEGHLNGTDVDANGETINIDDRHEGRTKLNENNIFFMVIIFFSRTELFPKKRLVQLLQSMITFNEKHLAAAVLHPLNRRLTFATTYSKKLLIHIYVNK